MKFTTRTKLRLVSGAALLGPFGFALVDFNRTESLVQPQYLSALPPKGRIQAPGQLRSPEAENNIPPKGTAPDEVFRPAVATFDPAMNTIIRDFYIIFAGLLFAGFLEFIRGDMESEEALTKIQGDIISTTTRLNDGFKQEVSEPVSQLFTTLGDRHRVMLDHLDSTVDCRYMGVAHKTIDELVEHLNRAVEVKNTFILFGLGESDAYSAKHFTSLARAVKRFLNCDKTWTDIVSQEVTGSPTRGWLKPIVDLHELAYGGRSKDGFAADSMESLQTRNQRTASNPEDGTPSNPEDAKTALDRYRIRRLKEEYPVINFMILRYGNDTREVIFGWGHHAKDPAGRVFLSRNKQLISTFDQYWDILEKDSVQVHLSNPVPTEVTDTRPITPSQVTGLWVRVSFEVDRDWKARGGIPQYSEPSATSVDPSLTKSQAGTILDSSRKLHDIALVRVRVKENRKLVVEGIRFEIDDVGSGKTKRIRRAHGFASRAADLEGLRLWFATSSVSKEELHIAGWYRFIPSGKTIWSKDLWIREFYGEFGEFLPVVTTESSEREPRQLDQRLGRLVVFGAKVRKAWLSEPNADDPASDVGCCAPEEFLNDWPTAPDQQIELVKRCLKWWHEKGHARWQYGEYSSEDLPLDGKTQPQAHSQNA